MVRPVAKSAKDSLCLYRKYNDIARKPNEYLSKEYRNRIGTECIEKSKNILRIERHLGSWKAIRQAFGIKKTNKINNKISLKSIINSNEKPIINRLNDYRLNIDFLQEKIELTKNSLEGINSEN